MGHEIPPVLREESVFVTVKKSFRRGEPSLAATSVFVGAICLTSAATRAQDVPAAPPKESAQKGIDFPKNEQKAPRPTDQVAPPTPGKNEVASLPQPLTLEAAIGFALRLQPTIAQAQANREASQERLKAQQSGYYPRLQPVYTYQNRFTDGQTTQFVGGVPVVINAGRTTDTKQIDANASFTVFDSFSRELNNKQARQSLRGQRFSEEDTRQRVIADVASNYFTSLRTAALVKVSEQQVARARNTLAVVQAQVEAKVAARKDIYQARADLLNAQVALLQAQNNAAVSQAQLKQSIGIVGGQPLTIADVPAPTENTPITALNAPAAPALTDTQTIDALAGTAYRSRPDIARSQQDVEVSQTAVGISRINNGLQANLSLSEGYQILPTGATDFQNTQNRLVNLTVSYPLFDGFLTRSQVRQSQANARNSESILTQLRQSVAVEVEQGWRTLTQSRAAIPAAESAQQAAQINYDAAVESRREGVGSIVEVIQAQTTLVQAQTNLVQAIYDFYSADARLARAVGYASRISGIARAASATAPVGTPAAGQTITPASPPGGQTAPPDRVP